MVSSIARQRALVGHVLEQRDQEFRLAVLIARNHAPGAEDALVAPRSTSYSLRMIAFGAVIAAWSAASMRRGCGEDFVGALADDLDRAGSG